MKQIYLDHSATTPTRPEVIELVYDLMKNHFGNPSSLHQIGDDARKYLQGARTQLAAALGAAETDEIYFTSGGTESDNLAILGLAEKVGKGHLMTSAVEHHAVLDACRYLGSHGFDLTILPVDQYGMVDPDEVKKNLRPDTFLVSLIHANNEVGTINPVAEIGKILKEAEVVFHLDAVQSFGKIPVKAHETLADMITVSGHKINGPKGIGALYKRHDLEINRRIFGGGQERGLRSGTENLTGIAGFGLAAELSQKEMAQHSADWQALRDHLVERLLCEIPDSRLNGHPTKRLPHNANISFNYIEVEALLLHLALNGVCCSAGSACSSSTGEPSHVLAAMGLAPEWAHGALRMTIGMGNTQEEIDATADLLNKKVEMLRLASPYYDVKTGGSSGLKPKD